LCGTPRRPRAGPPSDRAVAHFTWNPAAGPGVGVVFMPEIAAELPRDVTLIINTFLDTAGAWMVDHGLYLLPLGTISIVVPPAPRRRRSSGPPHRGLTPSSSSCSSLFEPSSSIPARHRVIGVGRDTGLLGAARQNNTRVSFPARHTAFIGHFRWRIGPICINPGDPAIETDETQGQPDGCGRMRLDEIIRGRSA
jgi:hypothetical protein